MRFKSWEQQCISGAEHKQQWRPQAQKASSTQLEQQQQKHYSSRISYRRFSATERSIVKVGTDSSSGKSVATRIGVSRRAKHIDLRFMFIQQLVHAGAVTLQLSLEGCSQQASLQHWHAVPIRTTVTCRRQVSHTKGQQHSLQRYVCVTQHSPSTSYVSQHGLPFAHSSVRHGVAEFQHVLHQRFSA